MAKRADAEQGGRPFYSDDLAQRKAGQVLRGVVQDNDAQWALLLAPSKMIGFDGRLVVNKDLWGHTHEGYGEKVAKFLRAVMMEPKIRGLVFTLLDGDKELKKEVLKALLAEEIDNVPLDQQRLYKTLR